jgi:hypothetical protein
MTLLTTKQVADKLGLKPRRLRAIAKNRNIGRKLGRDLVFYEEEVELLRPGKPGNREVYKHSPNWKKRHGK